MVQMSAILPNFTGFTITHGSFHLRLLEKLGSGAYGVVYLAQDLAPIPHGARFYAVKCLLRHADDSDFARQQQREIAHHRAVSDVPGVVTLHAVIEEEFYTFLVLDLVQGGDLFSAIMEGGTYTNNDEAVRRTMLQLVDGIDSLTSQDLCCGLIDKIVAALHGIVHMPLPVILFLVAQSRRYAALSCASVGARRIDLRQHSHASMRQLHCCHQARTTGTHNDNIKFLIHSF